MYCPQCSQQQGSEEMRFCFRCGFPLETVSQLVASGGVLPELKSEGSGGLTPRKKGVRLGGLLMFISVVLVPFVALMTAMESDFAVLFLPVLLLFMIGLVRLAYAYLFQPNTQPGTKLPLSSATVLPKQLQGTPRPGLPAHESVPVTSWRRANTSEIAQPPSVTDHTTKLLHDQVEEE